MEVVRPHESCETYTKVHSSLVKGHLSYFIARQHKAKPGRHRKRMSNVFNGRPAQKRYKNLTIFRKWR